MRGKKLKQKIAHSIISPPIITLAFCCLLIVINLLIAQHTRPYNSDDVSWQNSLLTWRPFSGHTLSLGGSDTYIVRVPLFILLGHFIMPSRRLLLMESATLAIGNFILFFIASLYFLRKVRIRLDYPTLIPFIWLASLGYSFSRLFLNPNLRSFEISLSFIAFMLAAKLYDRKPSALNIKSFMLMLQLVLLGAASGLLIYNDPYFLYFTVAPIGLFFLALLIMRKISRQKFGLVAVWTLLGLGFAKVVSLISVKAGIIVTRSYPVHFIAFDRLFSNIALTIHSTLVIFGADFFGKKVVDLETVSSLLNFVIIAIFFYKAYGLISKWRHSPGNEDDDSSSNLWFVFFALLSSFVLIVYAISNVSIDISSYRYLIIMAFAVPVYLAFYIGRLNKRKKLLLTIFTIAIGLNLLTSFSMAQNVRPDALQNRANAENFKVIDALQSRHIKKGYAPYWDAQINTYLSRGEEQFLPIVCIDSRVKPYHWLVNNSLYNLPAKQSFYILDPALTAPPNCTEDQVMEQFGRPAQSIPIDHRTIFIYNYDILTRMQ